MTDNCDFNEINLIKDVYNNVNARIPQNLIDNTIKKCEQTGRKSKRRVRYISVASLASGFVILFITLYVHFNIFTDFQKSSQTEKNITGKTTGSKATIKNTGGNQPVNSDQPVTFLTININLLGDEQSYFGIDSLMAASTDIVQCKITEMNPVVLINERRKIAGTIYTMKVIKSYAGNLTEGQEFKYTKEGGIFNYGTVYTELELSGEGYTVNDEMSKKNVEITYDNAPNLSYKNEYILFMSKENENNYYTTGKTDGLFTIKNNMISRYISDEYINIKSDYKMPLIDFIKLLN